MPAKLYRRRGGAGPTCDAPTDDGPCRYAVAKARPADRCALHDGSGYVDPTAEPELVMRWSPAPACWAWPVPDLADVVMPVRAAATDTDGIVREGMRFTLFHRDRCAVCGSEEAGALLLDHDHWTGLERGLLCRSCNAREGAGGGLRFDQYRRRNPASIVGWSAHYWHPILGEDEGETTRRARRVALPGRAGCG